jgi:hypothetical protein
MQIKHQIPIIDVGDFSSSDDFKKIIKDIRESIKIVDWPKGSGKFTLYPQSGKKRGEGNGVTPIKESFIANLESLGWLDGNKKGNRTLIPKDQIPSPFDVIIKVNNAYFVIEWETGNISSSHRAVNKMVFGVRKGVLAGGILVLPTANMAQYLTDRVGNFEELKPYFEFWGNYQCGNGYIGVIAIEHDGINYDVPRILKGTDGRAKYQSLAMVLFLNIEYFFHSSGIFDTFSFPLGTITGLPNGLIFSSPLKKASIRCLVISR